MRERDDGGVPKVFDIFHGEVASLQTYGAFVKIPGCRKQGLVHKSQLSTVRIDDPSEMLAKGERVYCKVIGMEGEGEKISLSMKVVNQTTGKDLDPNNVQLSQDEKKRRKWNFKGQNKIELGAELNTTCRKCGGHGHLAMDCFGGKEGNQYDLIPDLDQLTELPPIDKHSEGSHKKKKKKDKKKKEKKKRAKKRRSSSSSGSEEREHSDIDGKRRKKVGDTDKRKRSKSRSDSDSEYRQTVTHDRHKYRHENRRDNSREERHSYDHKSADEDRRPSLSSRKGREPRREIDRDRKSQRDKESPVSWSKAREYRKEEGNKSLSRQGKYDDKSRHVESGSESDSGKSTDKSNSPVKLGRDERTKRRGSNSNTQGDDGKYRGKMQGSPIRERQVSERFSVYSESKNKQQDKTDRRQKRRASDSSDNDKGSRRKGRSEERYGKHRSEERLLINRGMKRKEHSRMRESSRERENSSDRGRMKGERNDDREKRSKQGRSPDVKPVRKQSKNRRENEINKRRIRSTSESNSCSSDSSSGSSSSD